jgi:diacylglycerol O-acyltransferase/trehalose O-mycolyltransferase
VRTTVAPLAAAFVLVGAAACAAPASNPAASFALAADDGARIVDLASRGPRTRDLTVDSPAVGTVKVRLLVPQDYDTQSSKRFPVLTLLHGGGGDYTDWDQRTKSRPTRRRPKR